MRKYIRRIKIFIKQVLGSEPYVRIDKKYPMTLVGSKAYGAWHIILSGLNKDSIVYSFGVGEDASFDINLIERFSLDVYAFDPTPKSVSWVEKQKFPDNFKMHCFGIAGIDGNVPFNPPENSDHVSHTILDRPTTEKSAVVVPVKRLSTIMDELGHERIDILKMDIEGAEYEVVNDIANSSIRPKQILIEFHHRFPNVGANRTVEAIEKVRSIGYELFSISETNEEYSFIYKSE